MSRPTNIYYVKTINKNYSDINYLSCDIDINISNKVEICKLTVDGILYFESDKLIFIDYLKVIAIRQEKSLYFPDIDEFFYINLSKPMKIFLRNKHQVNIQNTNIESTQIGLIEQIPFNGEPLNYVAISVY